MRLALHLEIAGIETILIFPCGSPCLGITLFLIKPSLLSETTVRIECMHISVLLSWEVCLGRREPYDVPV